MGGRGEIIKAMHREMAREGRARAALDYAIYDPADRNARQLVGSVFARGLSDEINDRHYLIVDGVDGRAHYVEIGRADAPDAIPDVSTIALQPKRPTPRAGTTPLAEIPPPNA